MEPVCLVTPSLASSPQSWRREPADAAFHSAGPTCRSKDLCVASGASKFWRVIKQAGCYCVCVCVCVCLRVYATRQKGHLSLTCPCRAQHGCGLALAPCRGGGSPGRGLGEGDAWGLTGVPRLGDWNLGGQALGCGRVEPCPELSPTKFRASKTQ